MPSPPVRARARRYARPSGAWQPLSPAGGEPVVSATTTSQTPTGASITGTARPRRHKICTASTRWSTRASTPTARVAPNRGADAPPAQARREDPQQSTASAASVPSNVMSSTRGCSTHRHPATAPARRPLCMPPHSACTADGRSQAVAIVSRVTNQRTTLHASVGLPSKAPAKGTSTSMKSGCTPLVGFSPSKLSPPPVARLWATCVK